jgi:hypothetical protein
MTETKQIEAMWEVLDEMEMNPPAVTYPVPGIRAKFPAEAAPSMDIGNIVVVAGKVVKVVHVDRVELEFEGIQLRNHPFEHRYIFDCAEAVKEAIRERGK